MSREGGCSRERGLGRCVGGSPDGRPGDLRGKEPGPFGSCEPAGCLSVGHHGGPCSSSTIPFPELLTL